MRKIIEIIKNVVRKTRNLPDRLLLPRPALRPVPVHSRRIIKRK